MKGTYEKRNILYPVVSVVLCAALLLCVTSDFFLRSRKIQSDCLRLHIIASSDAEKDQSVKLKVRDALLSCGAEVFNGETDAHSALTEIIPYIPRLEKIADEVLERNGCAYRSKISIAREFFDTREYDGITFPAGKYMAFKVVLGAGKGRNWWCVMFPPLCLPAVTRDPDAQLYAVFGGNGVKLLKGKREYKVRFKIAEIIEKIINGIKEG